MTKCTYTPLESLDQKLEGYLIQFFVEDGIKALVRTADGRHIVTNATFLQVIGKGEDERYRGLIEDLTNLIHQYIPVPMHKDFINDFINIYNQ